MLASQNSSTLGSSIRSSKDDADADWRIEGEDAASCYKKRKE